jgi:hypothetical protein
MEWGKLAQSFLFVSAFLFISASSSNSEKSLAGFPKALVEKVRELQRVCGSRIVSAYRPGAVVCSRRKGKMICHSSNHARKKAVDMVGNPACMYARLRGFPGGVSTDYKQVNHIHISYNPKGMEWGSRFAHRSISTTRRKGYGG